MHSYKLYSLAYWDSLNENESRKRERERVKETVAKNRISRMVSVATSLVAQPVALIDASFG